MNSSDSQAVKASAPASSIVATLGSIYPMTVKKVNGKEYIKALEMHLYDLINVYTSPEKLEFLKNRKFSEIRTPNGNVRIIFMFHYQDDNNFKIALTVSYNTRNTYQAPTNSAILSHYCIYRKQYTINTDSPESPNKDENKLLNYVRNELKEIAKLEDNKFMYYYEEDETFKLIYLNKKFEYYYNDEEEQNEKIEEEREVHINLRRKIINDTQNNIMFKYSFKYTANDFKNIKENMYNFDIPYKKNNNKVIELLSITTKILKNQIYYGTSDIYEDLQEKVSALSDDFIRKNKFKNVVDMNDIYDIKDDDIKDKLKSLKDYINKNNYKQSQYNNIFYTATPQDSFKSLLLLIKFYLDIIKDDYDESPQDCVILTLIVFHYECLIDYINILRVLMNGSKIHNEEDENNLLGTFSRYMDIIQNSFLENPTRSYLVNNYNICSVNNLLKQLESDDESDDEEEPIKQVKPLTEGQIRIRNDLNLFRHIDNLKLYNNRFLYRGLLIMENMGSFYRIIYKSSHRVPDNERVEIINKIIDTLHENNLKMYFDRK